VPEWIDDDTVGAALRECAENERLPYEHDERLIFWTHSRKEWRDTWRKSHDGN
jgi:hypothetical protein